MKYNTFIIFFTLGGNMGKVEFARRTCDMLSTRIMALENYDLNTFLAYDKYFELVLSLGYLVLSKEKIIYKDKKEKDFLKRLHSLVDNREIDHVFAEHFSSIMPTLENARVNANQWILDNIRDSIMHEKFDIDLENELIIIDNDYYKRECKTKIPFQWIIDYAKYDILRKKKSKHCLIKGFYYNKYFHKNWITDFSDFVKNNIFYYIDIYGEPFSITEVRERIFGLLDESLKGLPEENEKHPFKEYKRDFCKIQNNIYETIKKEFPRTYVHIGVDNNKEYILKQVEGKKVSLPYDVVFEQMQNKYKKRSWDLLNLITDTLNLLGKNVDTSKNRYSYEIMKNFASPQKEFQDLNSTYLWCRNKKNELQCMTLVLEGIISVVMNYDTFKSNTEDCNPYFMLKGVSKKNYLDYIDKVKNCTMQKLRLEELLINIVNNYNRCNDIKAKEKLNLKIKELRDGIQKIENTLKNLDENFVPCIDEKKAVIYKEEVERIAKELEKNCKLYSTCKDKEKKKIYKSIILELFEARKQRESLYMMGKCSLEEGEEIMRNSLAHAGRISLVSRYNALLISFRDYDEYGITGEVICKYSSFCQLIEQGLNTGNSLELKKKMSTVM